MEFDKDDLLDEDDIERVERTQKYVNEILSGDDDELTEGEYEFCKDMKHRLKKYGMATKISDKQFHWIKKIAERLEEL